jgi:hypothetical protein
VRRDDCIAREIVIDDAPELAQLHDPCDFEPPKRFYDTNKSQLIRVHVRIRCLFVTYV